MAAGPYMETLQGVNIPTGTTLTITSLIGSLTSYTQQYEQLARVSMVATPNSQNGKATPGFIPNAPLPSLDSLVDGVLDAGRIEIVDGFLSGTGTVKGSLNIFGPVRGYADPIELKRVGKEPIDPSWDNRQNTIRGTDGGFLVAGRLGATPGSGTPGKLTVTGDVSLFGASFVAYATGAAAQGSDYSWLSSAGKVNLGSSKLDLSLIGYTPRAGDSLTIITAANGITGKFSQGDSITVNGFRFNITYNANSVVLTHVLSLGATALVVDTNPQVLAKLGAVPATPEGVTPFSPDSNGNSIFDAGDQVFGFGLNSDHFFVGRCKPTGEIRVAADGALHAPLHSLADDTAFAAAVDQAIGLWAQAGLDPASLARLPAARYGVGTLGGATLAVRSGDDIPLDATAAGRCWSTAKEPGKMDLLTALDHEMGHTLGLDHCADPADVMFASPLPGSHKAPTTQDVDALFASMTLRTQLRRTAWRD
jgi:hypothetical protein